MSTSRTHFHKERPIAKHDGMKTTLVYRSIEQTCQQLQVQSQGLSTVSVSSSSMKEVIPVRWLKTEPAFDSDHSFPAASDTSVLQLHLSPCRRSLDSETPVPSLHTPDALAPLARSPTPATPPAPVHFLWTPRRYSLPPDPPARSPPQRLSPLTFFPEFNKT
ncbi:hypothetical protein PAMA_016954 [Pampus argenteus]